MPSFAAEVDAQGYALVEHVFDSREMGEISALLDRESLARSRAGVRHAMRIPAVADIAHDLRLPERARAVLGPEAVPFRATFSACRSR